MYLLLAASGDLIEECRETAQTGLRYINLSSTLGGRRHAMLMKRGVFTTICLRGRFGNHESPANGVRVEDMESSSMHT